MDKLPVPSITIAGRTIGAGHPPLLIAEVAQAHDGSLGMAHAFIDAAEEAHADAIKFQTHIAAAESTLDEQFRVLFSRQDESRYSYWKRMEFTPEQWAGLVDHARKKNLIFLSSAFSLEAVSLLARLGMPAWKIASGEIGSTALIDAMAATSAPFLVSTGMSSWSEIGEIVSQLRSRGAACAMLQCTSKYPTPLEQVGLNVIDELRKRFVCPVGLSDHSGTIFPALAAIASGSSLVELHITLDRRMFGPDAASSLTVSEFKLVAEARDAFARMASHPVNKDAIATELADMRSLFMRSAAPTRALQAGTVLAADMITAKKPGTGIPASEIPRLIGRRLLRTVTPERLFTREDIGD